MKTYPLYLLLSRFCQGNLQRFLIKKKCFRDNMDGSRDWHATQNKPDRKVKTHVSSLICGI